MAGGVATALSPSGRRDAAVDYHSGEVSGGVRGRHSWPAVAAAMAQQAAAGLVPLALLLCSVVQKQRREREEEEREREEGQPRFDSN